MKMSDIFIIQFLGACFSGLIVDIIYEKFIKKNKKEINQGKNEKMEAKT